MKTAHDEIINATKPISTDLSEDEVYSKVNTLQFDPIDQIDEIDKNNNYIDLRREGVYLSDLLKGVTKTMHTFRAHHIKDNKRWKEVDFGIIVDARSDYEFIVRGKKNHYYIVVD
jgi:hypothetical protein